MGVSVGVSVGVAVGVSVGVAVGVSVGVAVGVFVGVFVGVLVGVLVDVLVGVAVGVRVGVAVGVSVGVCVGVDVAVDVGVLVGVSGAPYSGASAPTGRAPVVASTAHATAIHHRRRHTMPPLRLLGQPLLLLCALLRLLEGGDDTADLRLQVDVAPHRTRGEQAENKIARAHGHDAGAVMSRQ